MADAVDDDLLRAVQAFWRADPVLPGLVDMTPGTGRLVSPESSPYVELTPELEKKDMQDTSFGFLDHRRLTIVVRGLVADVVRVHQAAGDAFTVARMHGLVSGVAPLTFPSGARLFRAVPTGETIRQEEGDPEKTVKDGQETWKGELHYSIVSIRSK